MKIIRPGVLNTEVLCGTCERCGCEVEVSKEECKELTGFSADSEHYKFIVCPTPFCGEQIRIYAK